MQRLGKYPGHGKKTPAMNRILFTALILISCFATCKKSEVAHNYPSYNGNWEFLGMEGPLGFQPSSCFRHHASKSAESLAGIELILGNGCPALNLGDVYPPKEE